MPLLQRPCWAKNGSGRFVPRGPHYSGGKGMRTEDHHLGSAGQDGPKGKEKQRYSSLVSSLTLTTRNPGHGWDERPEAMGKVH